MTAKDQIPPSPSDQFHVSDFKQVIIHAATLLVACGLLAALSTASDYVSRNEVMGGAMTGLLSTASFALYRWINDNSK